MGWILLGVLAVGVAAGYLTGRWIERATWVRQANIQPSLRTGIQVKGVPYYPLDAREYLVLSRAYVQQAARDDTSGGNRK